MGGFNFRTDSFKQFLKDKESQIHIRTESGIQETDNFKNLHRCIATYHRERPIQDFTAILISKDEISNLITDFSDKLFKTLDENECIINNHLLFDGNLDLIKVERKEIKNNNDARKYYLELSCEVCVFLINPKGVHYFVDGKDVGEAIFFTTDALNTYNELKDITKIIEIFDEYRSHLKVKNNYYKFFASKSTKSSLCKHLIDNPTKKQYEDFNNEHKQLLENKPEDRFRDDLRMYLTKNLKATVLSKEYILENFKRLDIFINDDFGELYLIEVKWVGVSIHSLGQKIGTCYEAKDINPNAVLQTVDYIRQLNNERKNIKLAYLAVFDARNEDLPDTVDVFDEKHLIEDLSKYYPRFKKIPDFKVINQHPS
ncbi:hypothetical protein [Lutibacter maritimus]|uniref:Uncharacterized protein n=1 Tax=Lutibacter maritimus TaxID=593133 RepID=A0A1I6NRY6_9FLAO|nr:hypothetical protein [Lutibacter maritimus]SFS30639.1 hypothetical protein SAMN04488006_0463 [Lutibacter maritimus]